MYCQIDESGVWKLLMELDFIDRPFFMWLTVTENIPWSYQERKSTNQFGPQIYVKNKELVKNKKK